MELKFGNVFFFPRRGENGAPGEKPFWSRVENQFT